MPTYTANQTVAGVYAGSSGPTQVTFAESTASPNDTVYVDSMTAAGATTNVDLALRPKGTGALTAQVADSAATGGNKRGANAVDWQTIRANAGQVASGTSSTIAGGLQNESSSTYTTVGGGWDNRASSSSSTIAGGQGNRASGTQSAVAGGLGNNASGTQSTIAGGGSNSTAGNYATVGGGQSNVANSTHATAAGGYNNYASNTGAVVAGGRNNTASGPDSVVSGGNGNNADTYGNSTISGGYFNSATYSYGTIPGGVYALADRFAKYAYAAGRFLATGDAQFSRMVLRAATATATPFVLTADGDTSQNVNNSLVLTNNRAHGYTIALVANSSASGPGANYGVWAGNWSLRCLVRKTSPNNTITIVGTPSVAPEYIDAAISACSVALSVNTSLGSLAITVTGIAGFNIHWVAVVTATEVG
jgi:hypothetical protein